ncbi:MAG: beta-lactamase family protein [Deltaproteobacteria bacterium]|jgi:CubicO group peptidase (beta-lactamase class C family)|nr:beta-lactamase family protein [Deltaproteobacteria bacterium]
MMIQRYPSLPPSRALRPGVAALAAAFAALALALSLWAPGTLLARKAGATAGAVTVDAVAGNFSGNSGAGGAEAPAELEDALRAVLEVKIGKGDYAGAVFAGRAGDREVLVAAGMSDLVKRTPMPPDTLFRLSSVSKAFTSVLAARMVKSGEIGLEDPVTRHLPWFTPEAPDGSTPEIRFRHLLTHTAGLGYGFSETDDGPLHRAGVSDGCGASQGLTLEENMRRLAGVPLLFEPGERFSYSLAADAAGAVMSVAAGKPLQELMRERVLDPLGLGDTAFHALDPSRLGRQYVYSNKGPRPRLMSDPERYPLGHGRHLDFSPSRALDPSAWPSGGCGMVSTASDVLKLLDAVLALAGGTEEERWFMEDAIAPMEAQKGEGFGGGWAYVRDPGPRPFSRGTVAWGGVYGHRWFADPEAGVAGVLLTNTSMKGMSGDTVDLLAELLYPRPDEGGRGGQRRPAPRR